MDYKSKVAKLERLDVGSELTKEVLDKIKELADKCRSTWTTHNEKVIWDTAGEVHLVGRKEFDGMLVVKMQTEVIEYAVTQLPKEIEKSRRSEITEYILDKKTQKWFGFESYLNIYAKKYWRKRQNETRTNAN